MRNLDTDWSASTFLVTAVTTILAIRFVLFSTGYPQIGSGGLFMVVALVIFISFLDQFAHRVAVLLGGIGLARSSMHWGSSSPATTTISISQRSR